MTQIPVTTHATQALPALGGGVVTLYNSDLTNVAYVSYSQWFAPGAPNSVPIQPLANATLDASKAIYVAGLVAGQGPLFVAPGGTQLQPSPAQVAAQIGALGLATLSQQITQQTAIPNNMAVTGIPLLRLNSPIDSATNQPVAAGATATKGPYTMTQIGFYLWVAINVNASATVPFFIVTLNWTDASTGFQMNQDTFVLPGAATGQQFAIFGQVFSNQLTITFNNNDTLAGSYSFQLISTSQVHSVEPTILCEQLTKLVVPGYPGPTQNIDAGLVFATQIGVNPGGNQSRIVPVYTGEVLSIVTEQGVGSGNATYKMTPAVTLYGFNSAEVVDGTNTISGGVVPYQTRLKLPRTAMFTNYANAGSVVANFTHLIFSASSN
jgi:hypothetical protein